MRVLLEYWWVLLIVGTIACVYAIWWANRYICPHCGQRRRMKRGIDTFARIGNKWVVTEIHTLRCTRGICSDKGIPLNREREASFEELEQMG